jgi:hypothetical protein
MVEKHLGEKTQILTVYLQSHVSYDGYQRQGHTQYYASTYLVLPSVDLEYGDVPITIYLVSWRMAGLAFQLLDQPDSVQEA